jgi:hypothetical protein
MEACQVLALLRSRCGCCAGGRAGGRCSSTGCLLCLQAAAAGWAAFLGSQREVLRESMERWLQMQMLYDV